MVKRVSAVGFCLCGAVKNIIIICVSESMLGEERVMQQVLGYMFALTNVVMYSLSKQVVGVFDDGYCSGVAGLANLARESLGVRSNHTTPADVELESEDEEESQPLPTGSTVGKALE